MEIRPPNQFLGRLGGKLSAAITKLILTTGHSYAQYNTVLYKAGKKYREMPHRNCILMNPKDAEEAGLQEHQRFTVRGDAGKLQNVD